MSVRAHRIIKIDYADSPSFNLYSDEKLTSFLDSHGSGFWGSMNNDGCGMVTIETSTLKTAIRQHKKLGLDEYTVKAIKADIAFADKEDNDYVEYDCF